MSEAQWDTWISKPIHFGRWHMPQRLVDLERGSVRVETLRMSESTFCIAAPRKGSQAFSETRHAEIPSSIAVYDRSIDRFLGAVPATGLSEYLA